MEHTEYYHLPQWEETDRIQMDDFNDAMEKLDTAVAAAPRIATGTYTGTGDGYVHLNFAFTPKAIFITKTDYPRYRTFDLLRETDSDYISIFMTIGNLNPNSASAANCRYRLRNNEFSIVNVSEREYGLNEANATYLYAAIG